MPGPLQFHDIQAPDFSSAIQGIRAFGDLMGKATEMGQDTVKGITTSLDQNAERELQTNLLRYTTPDAVRAAIADKSAFTGVNMNHLTGAQIADVPGQHITDMLEQASKGITNETNTDNLHWNQFQHKTDQADIESEIAARPYQADLIRIAHDPQLTDSQRDVAISDYYKSNPQAREALSKLKYGAQMANAKGIQELVTGGLGIDRDRIGNKGAGLDVADKMDTYLSAPIVNAVRQSGTTMADWERTFNTTDWKKLGYTDQQVLKARTALFNDPTARSGFIGSEGGSAGGGGSGGSGGGGGAGYSAVYGNGAYGAPSVDPTNMTLAQVLEFGDNTLRPATKAKGIGVINGQVVGTSAMGGYQIVGDTLRKIAPDVLGANWQNEKFTPEVQDRLGKAIYDKAPVGSDLHNVWTSLPQGTIKTGSTSWDNLKPRILQGESGLSLALQNGSNVVASVTNATANQAASPQQALARNLMDRAKDDSSAQAVAQKLTGKDGELAGQKAEYVNTVISKIIDRSGGRINAATAGYIASQAVDGQKSLIPRLWAKIGGDGIDQHFNWSKIDNLIHTASDPKTLQAAAVSNFANGQTSQMAQQGLQMMQQAQQMYTQELLDAQNLGRKPNLARAEAMRVRGQQMYQQGLGLNQEVAAAGNPPSAPTARKPSGGSTPKVASAPVSTNQQAINARAFLQRKVAEALQGAGPTQVPLIKQELARQWHLKSLDSINHPDIAWTVAKALDAAAPKPGQARVGMNGVGY